MVRVVAPTAGVGKISNLRVLPIPWCRCLDSNHHLPIEIVGIFLLDWEGIETTEGVDYPNRGVMVRVVAPSAGIGKISNLRVLPIPGCMGLDSDHHPPIEIVGILPFDWGRQRPLWCQFCLN
ncbi:hypothetical protein CRG98_040035 [Punica granatum]|uniref:Uncharacterized protein n=1 Tax=Punica granatum TaxID=22663 RepID=A0A2I0I6E8_PUNGR|nr:hypothetical protein CRG98_040035 [Punica granatum]